MRGFNFLAAGIAIAVAAVFGLLSLVIGWVWTVGILVGIVVVLGLFLLAANRTAWGKRLAQAIGIRLYRTRLGKRLASSQLRSQAERSGVATTDRMGRKLSDIELQIEMADTPETQLLKKQLKAMNPQQRAQALRMLQAQMDAVTGSGTAPDDLRSRSHRRGNTQPKPKRQGKLR